MEKIKRDKKQVTAGRIVAELNFGFCTSLLDSRYEQTLWPKIARTTFPHLSRKHRNRRRILFRLSRIRHLRNRVFHYEPVWHWKDLKQQHLELSTAIDWISPTVRRTVDVIDRFSEVYESGYEPYYERLSTLMAEAEYQDGP